MCRLIRNDLWRKVLRRTHEFGLFHSTMVAHPSAGAASAASAASSGAVEHSIERWGERG